MPDLLEQREGLRGPAPVEEAPRQRQADPKEGRRLRSDDQLRPGPSPGTASARLPGASGPIALAAPALVSVTATVQLFNIDAAAAHGFSCQSELRPAGGTAVVMGSGAETVAAFGDRTVSWTAVLAVDPGTYDVGVKCAVRFQTTSGWVTSADVVMVPFAR